MAAYSGDDPDSTIPAIRPGIQTRPKERRLLSAGIKLAEKDFSTSLETLISGAAPSASADSISPICDSTSERKRSSASALVFIALAMIMLPIGTVEVIAPSITPAHVITAMTDPDPSKMDQNETAKLPGIVFVRRAEVAPAASTIAESMNTLVHCGPLSITTKTKPTATICAKPRMSAITVAHSV